MPTAGPSQSLDAGFGQNLQLLPSKLFETMLPMLPIPTRIERWPLVVLVCVTAIVVVVGWFLVQVVRRRHPLLPMILAYTLYALAIVGLLRPLLRRRALSQPVCRAALATSDHRGGVGPARCVADAAVAAGGRSRAGRRDRCARPLGPAAGAADAARRQGGGAFPGRRLGRGERRLRHLGRRGADRHARLLARPDDQPRRQGEPARRFGRGSRMATC